MKKSIVILFAFCLVLVVFLSGCTDNDDGDEDTNGDTNGGITDDDTTDDDTTGNTYTMTAKEHTDDMTTDSDWTTYITILYDTVEEGDTVIIQDTIRPGN